MICFLVCWLASWPSVCQCPRVFTLFASQGGPFGMESRLEGINYELRGAKGKICPEGQYYATFQNP